MARAQGAGRNPRIPRRRAPTGTALAAILTLMATAGPPLSTRARAQVQEDTTRAAPAPAAPAARLELKALLDLDYTATGSDGDELDPGFSLRRVRLITQGALGERIGYRVLLEPSGLALGPSGAAPFRGVPLVEAAAEYRVLPSALLRLGQQRLPFGLAASIGAPSLPTPEYPQGTRLLMQRVSIFRDIGLSASGRAGGLEYGAGIFNGAGINVPRDNNGARDLLGRASYALLPGWTVGASGWRGRSGELYAPDGEPRRTFHDDASFLRWGADSRLARGRLQLAAEYLHDRTRHNPNAVNPTPGGETLERSGWYAMAALRPLRRLELVARFDRWDPDHTLRADVSTEYVVGVVGYLLEAAAPADPRLGLPLNPARRHGRLMLFLEHLDPEAAPSTTTARLRWELFY